MAPFAAAAATVLAPLLLTAMSAEQLTEPFAVPVGSMHAPYTGALPPKPRRRSRSFRRRSFAQVARDEYDDSGGNSLPQAGRVMYYVYSDSKFYNTRLRYVLDTWATRIPKQNFAVIGDAPYLDNASKVSVHATDCPAHSHWEGACCKYAKAVSYAYEDMEKDPSITWAYFVDDDTYVRPEVLEMHMAAQSDPEQEGLVLGRLGCSTASCAFGICAGGGYAANRRAVYKAVSRDEVTFGAQQMAYCAKCSKWADVAITQIFIDKEVEFREVKALEGWPLTKDHFDKRIAAEEEPIMFHYIKTQSQMNFLHHLFGGGPPVADAESDDPQQCTKYHGKRECARSSSHSDTPWWDVNMIVKSFGRQLA